MNTKEEKEMEARILKVRGEIKRALEAIARWPDPQKGAGEGIGPLAGVGMYIQYKQDREEHEKQIRGVIAHILGLFEDEFGVYNQGDGSENFSREISD